MALWLRAIVTACLILFSHGQDAIDSENVLESGPGSDQLKLEPVEINLHRNNRRQGDPDGPWCTQAKACAQDRVSICGYDEQFGFGRFEDFCHLLEVNCYWNYNFVLHSCKPLYLKRIPRPLLGQVPN